MIYGIGIDIIELKRIEDSIERSDRLISRVLTEREQELYQTLSSQKRRHEFIAGRFAAKEACSKALGTGIGKYVSFQDIEVLKDSSGAPTLEIFHYPHLQTYISISHSDHYAVSQVVLTKKE